MTKRSPVKLAVFCSGFGSNFQAILDAARRKKISARVALMVCDNPRAPALLRARRHRVPVVLVEPRLFKTRENYERFLGRILKNQEVDAVVLAGFMRIFSPVFIRAFRGRILNVHPSFLPRFKGARAIEDAFRAKAKETGVSVHLVTETVDAGPILLQRKVKILKTDTLKTLTAKIHKVEHQIYPLAIQQFIQRRGKNVKGRH
ncbi:MAG: phosphoribosylglycinamide formyltransferase [Candidatus Omnitrophica bacterium]|nr:phosphoribosylglycinamide formyltransferase [Candidatus Omnitrophota bacterium]